MVARECFRHDLTNEVFATRAVSHEPMMTLKAVALLNMFPRAPRLRVQC